jgi:hypothetical protein
MRIIGPASATYNQVSDYISRAGWAFFRANMLDPLWLTATDYGIDPVGVVAQSLHETGNGLFPGNVKPWFHNTCGLKVRNDKDVMAMLGTTNENHPLVHAQFANWWMGALAQVQHLRIYAGWPVDTIDIVDPRYVWVEPKGYRLESFRELSGRWAPASDYGDRIERKMGEISGL